MDTLFATGISSRRADAADARETERRLIEACDAVHKATDAYRAALKAACADTNPRAAEDVDGMIADVEADVVGTLLKYEDGATAAHIRSLMAKTWGPR